MLSIRPRRAVTSPMTSPMNSSGVVDLELHDRLEQRGIGLARGFLHAIEPAILNAISVESTSW